MRLVLRPTIVQPSSTTLRYTITVENIDERQKVFLEQLEEIGGFTLYVDEKDKRIFIHDSGVQATYSSLAILYILKKMRAREVYAAEGNPVCLDVGAGNIEYWEPERVNLVIVDPAIGCHVQCPWCYARPRPLDNSVIAPHMATEKWRLIRERLVENTVRTVKTIVEKVSKEGKIPHVTIVVGGSIDPTSLPTHGLMELYYNIHDKLREEGLDTWVYYALTTSNPVEFVPRYEHMHNLLKKLSYWSEIVVTMLPPHLARRHPMFSRNIEAYYEAVEWLAGKGVTLAYILTKEDPIANGHYDRLKLRVLNLLASARKVFLLSYHPAPGMPYKPPTRETIVDFIETLVTELCKTMDTIEMDACTGIRLGFPANAINKAETTAMYHCTPSGCQKARICPRNAPKCIARH